MLLDQVRLNFAYEQILQDAAKARGACSVLVFVAPNCDAMCACRILSYMLRADAVSYKIKPVAGYGDIATANEDLIKVRFRIVAHVNSLQVDVVPVQVLRHTASEVAVLVVVNPLWLQYTVPN